MNKYKQAQYEARAEVIKAMAHPARLCIVDMLSKKPCCVAELTAMIDSDMSTVSKHLSVLKNPGIIAGRKEGTKVIYSLAMPCVMNFFGCVDQVLERTAKIQLALVRSGK